MGLLAVNIDARRHYVYAGDCVGGALSAFAQHLHGDRDDIHDGVCISVMITRFDDLDVYFLYDFAVFSGQRVQAVFCDGHLAISSDLVFVAELHIVHVESSDHQSSEFNVCHCIISFRALRAGSNKCVFVSFSNGGRFLCPHLRNSPMSYSFFVPICLY